MGLDSSTLANEDRYPLIRISRCFVGGGSDLLEFLESSCCMQQAGAGLAGCRWKSKRRKKKSSVFFFVFCVFGAFWSEPFGFGCLGGRGPGHVCSANRLPQTGAAKHTRHAHAGICAVSPSLFLLHASVGCSYYRTVIRVGLEDSCLYSQ